MEENVVPIIALFDQLLVPIQGELTDQAADSLVARLVNAVEGGSADGVILELSAVWMMDSHLCALLARLVQTLELMGTSAVVTGLSPEIVTTLMEMGVTMDRFTTALSLEAALESVGIGRLGRSSSTPIRVNARKNP
jgi:rsbT antagonist protein RsbS